MLFRTLSTAVYGIDANLIGLAVDVGEHRSEKRLSSDRERLLERAMQQPGLSARATTAC